MFFISLTPFNHKAPGIFAPEAFKITFYQPAVRWQATKWPFSISTSSGPSVLHRSVAYGQRAAKRQPGFGLIGEVISPFSIIRSLFFFKLGTGIAESRAWVYG